MSSSLRRYRIIILGAGFSAQAGLPLGGDLLRLVLDRSVSYAGEDNALVADLRRFQDFKRRCDNCTENVDALDLEEFVSFLDTEHALGFRGGDTWSRDGNEGQIL